MKNIPVAVAHRGSTAFEILGKGDIDIGVYAHEQSYQPALRVLTKIYNQPRVTGEDFAAFYLEDSGFEVEISLMKGYEAEVDQALTKRLLQDKKLIQKYAEIKKKYAYSKREYLIQRNRFFSKILRTIEN